MVISFQLANLIRKKQLIVVALKQVTIVMTKKEEGELMVCSAVAVVLRRASRSLI